MSKPVKLGLFEDILNDEINLRVKVTGRSMTPFLRGGEILTIKKASLASLKKGDLIFFKDRNGSPVLHRIIKRSTISVQTKGDALMAFDEPICANDVLGKVCVVEKANPDSKLKSINMESFMWRTINYLIALFNSVRTKTYFSARRIYRFQKEKKYSLNLFRS
jgi:signal peptidase I